MEVKIRQAVELMRQESSPFVQAVALWLEAELRRMAVVESKITERYAIDVPASPQAEARAVADAYLSERGLGG